MRSQSIRDLLVQLKIPYQLWMAAVLDDRIAAGQDKVAARFGAKASRWLVMVDDFLDELPGEDTELTSDQAYVAGLLVGTLTYAVSSEVVDAKGTIKPKEGVALPEDNPLATGVIKMRAILESFQVV